MISTFKLESRQAWLFGAFNEQFHLLHIYLITSFAYTGEARIRVQISAAHSTEEIERCVDAFVDVGKTKGVI